MRTLAIVLVALASGCGPMGNALGLQGTYTGESTISGSGKHTSYLLGVVSVVRDVVIDDRAATTLTVAAGYQTDAVLTGDMCSLPLEVDGDSLKLVEATSCDTDQKRDVTVGSNTTVTETQETKTIGSAEVYKLSDTVLRVQISLTQITSTTEDSVKTEDSEIDLTMNFEGERVAGE